MAIQELLRHKPTLHAAAGAAGLDSLSGRGPVYRVLVPGTNSDWVVRHYYRGGGMRFLGDRYVVPSQTFLTSWKPRPFRELAISEELRALGFRTPSVAAAVVYPDGLFYRGDIATEFVDGSVELSEALYDQAARRTGRGTLLSEIRAMIDKLDAAGVYHPDLNAKNFLLTADASEGDRLTILDLDQCTRSDEDRGRTGAKMLSRLRRSIRKLETKGKRKLTTEEWKRLK